jgi:hypothetical protein
MIQIPYGAIGIGIGLVLGIWALVEADSAGARVLIAGLMLAIFFLPVLWRGPAGHVARLIGWVLFGIGCYIFIKARGAPLR